jgi:hypothetical protein
MLAVSKKAMPARGWGIILPEDLDAAPVAGDYDAAAGLPAANGLSVA